MPVQYGVQFKCNQCGKTIEVWQNHNMTHVAFYEATKLGWHAKNTEYNLCPECKKREEL